MNVRRIGSAVLSAAVLVGLGGGIASAHVTVSGPDATQGGEAVLTFLVPTESDTASTVGLQVQLPTTTPIASVAIEAKTGWSYTVKKVTLSTPIQTDDGPVSEAISEIDWTATAGGIKPGEFGQFAISAGPLPKQSAITFKVIQRYSDNSTVAWVEVPAAGSSAEPEHPAPTLSLAPAEGTTSTASSTNATSSATASASSEHDHALTTSSDSRTTTALITSAIAVLLAAVGAGLGFLAWRRDRPAAAGDHR